MIQASELRIGNWVNNDNGIPVKIQSIESDEMYHYNSSDSRFIYLENGEFRYSYDDSISGIPLTEELLLKMGFEYFEWDSKWQKGDIQIDSNDGLSYYILIASITRAGKAIQYVHQLQNLYFALCSQELTI